MKKNNFVIVAYSGGLDTSYCIKYLTEERGLDVHAILVDTGGFRSEQIADAKNRALLVGAVHFEVLPATDAFYEKFIQYLIYGNCKRNHSYPLSVSAERVVQALKIAQYASAHGIQKICHGSTGAGNDQIRFDGLLKTIIPDCEIITPIRDESLSRAEEIQYLNKDGIIYTEKKGKYSINQGLWGTSIGGAETLTSHLTLPDDAWPTPLHKSEPEIISLTFQKGVLTHFNGSASHPIDIIQALHAQSAPFGIGREIHVGDTIIGIKGRVGFEAPAPLIILAAHRLLEKHTLSKWQQHWKDQLGEWYGMLLHEGQYLDPIMRDIEAFLTSSQQTVSGEVRVRLLPRTFQLIGIESAHDLAAAKYGSYGETTQGWTPEQVKGFIHMRSLADRIYHDVHGHEVIHAL